MKLGHDAAGLSRLDATDELLQPAILRRFAARDVLFENALGDVRDAGARRSRVDVVQLVGRAVVRIPLAPVLVRGAETGVEWVVGWQSSCSSWLY